MPSGRLRCRGSPGMEVADRTPRSRRIRRDVGKLEQMRRDLGTFLVQIRELEGVDISGVPSMVGASEHTAPMRADLVSPDSLHLSLEEIAPAFEQGFFVVPRLAALDADLVSEGDSA